MCKFIFSLLEMWVRKDIISVKTFGLICVVTFLLLYCGIRSLQIQDMTIFVAEYHDEILTDNLEYDDIERPFNDTRPKGIDKITYPIFQPNESIEFSHIVNGTIRIPHIIHQICNTPMVPDQFVQPMKSFVKYNPKWQYRFWTYESGRKLLKKHHPYLIKTYDKFGENDVKKSDLLRYAVLYEYGGVYADLDVKNVRPLDITTTKYACIVPTEPFEHSGIIYLAEAVMSSAVLLCRPKHPFFEQLLLNLQLADPKGHPVGTSGPVYLTKNYLKYNNLTTEDLSKTAPDNKTNSPYFYKGTRDVESDDGIYIPNSQYFMDDIDPDRFNEDRELNDCIKKPLHKLEIIKQRACKEFESRKQLRKERTYAFTVHYWFHLWTKSQDHMRRVNLTEFIPTAILYDE